MTQMMTRKDATVELTKFVVAKRHKIFKGTPRGVDPARLEAMAIQSLTANPDLTECTPASFGLAVMAAASYGLEIGSGPIAEAYLVPFARKGQAKKECTLIIGYKGLLKLARNSGVFRGYSCDVVREGDQFVFKDGLDPVCEFTPSGDKDRITRPVTHVYFAARLTDGTPVVAQMSREEIDAHAKQFSKGLTRPDSPWVTSWEAMAKKTVLRAVLQSGKIPLAAQTAQFVATEQIDNADLHEEFADYEQDVVQIEDNHEA